MPPFVFQAAQAVKEGTTRVKRRGLVSLGKSPCRSTGSEPFDCHLDCRMTVNYGCGRSQKDGELPCIVSCYCFSDFYPKHKNKGTAGFRRFLFLSGIYKKSRQSNSELIYNRVFGSNLSPRREIGVKNILITSEYRRFHA